MLARIVLIAVLFAAVALASARAMPGDLGQRAESSTVDSSSTPLSGGGGNGGSNGWCWSGSSCRHTCQQNAFASGYCFIFTCYCSNE